MPSNFRMKLPPRLCRSHASHWQNTYLQSFVNCGPNNDASIREWRCDLWTRKEPIKRVVFLEIHTEWIRISSAKNPLHRGVQILGGVRNIQFAWLQKTWENESGLLTATVRGKGRVEEIFLPPWPVMVSTSWPEKILKHFASAWFISQFPQRFFSRDVVRAGFARRFGMPVDFSIFISGYEDYQHP